MEDQVILGPARPSAWDVAFRLHASRNTVVKGEVRAGQVVGLLVTPESRKAEISSPESCQEASAHRSLDTWRRPQRHQAR